MKNRKKYSYLISGVIALTLTLIVAEIFSIYHFGSVPTLLTSLYLISIFAIIEYLFIAMNYIIAKRINRQKIGARKVIALLLFFVAVLLVLAFLVVLNLDWLVWYAYSSPFYFDIIYRSFEFLVPAIVLGVVGFVLFRR